MQQYHDMLRHIMDTGVDKSDRTGTGTRSVFGYQARMNLADGFPLITTKDVFLRGVIAELLWFLSGSTNIRPLVTQQVSIWTDWPLATFNKMHVATGGRGLITKAQFEKWIAEDESFAKTWGDLGPVYSRQWRSFRGANGKTVDQISNVIDQIKSNPDSRRLIVSAWNPAEIEECALPPCHAFFQFYVVNGRLSCQLYQRSADCFLGVPFNWASYALLTLMIAQVCDLEPGELIWTGGDTHIYQNHFKQVEMQLGRNIRPLPQMTLNRKVRSIFDFKAEDFSLTGYDPHPAIRAPVAV